MLREEAFIVRRITLLWVAMGCGLVLGPAHAQTGREVLEGVRDDARREAAYVLQSRFPYGGSLYGLPGQTRSDSIRESAVRAAIGGLMGSCHQTGTVDLGKLPANLKMDVGGILANTRIEVPDVKTPSGGALLNPGDLIPKPTAVSQGQVLVGGDWMPEGDYQKLRTQTQMALQERARAQSSATPSGPSMKAPAAAPRQSRPISKIWAAPSGAEK